MKIILKNLNLLFGIMILSSIIACNSSENNKNKNIEQAVVEIDSLKQSKDDLLTGVTRAVCYSGFRTGQHPDRGDGAVNPSYEEIVEDLNILSRNTNFKLIRLYDSGENSEMVIKAISENNIDIKVMLGIWLKAELSNHEKCSWLDEPIPDETLAANKVENHKEMETAINLSNKFSDIIVAVNVGNEALVEWNDHLMNIDTVISYVKNVKAAVKQTVTVAENYAWWADHGKELAKVVDFVSVHTYPLWEGKDIDSAMIFTIENLMRVRRALPDSKIVISEAGWTDVASEFGERASEDKQLQYFNELMNFVEEKNITTFFFEAFDEDWKGNPDNMMGAEKHWGLFTVDRKAKKVMHELYPDLK